MHLREKKNITGVHLDRVVALTNFKGCQCKLLSVNTAQTCILVWD